MRALVIGCGNLLRGDDAAGPVLVRRLLDRGLPDGVRCADGGTGGMDVAFQMRGVPHVILVDACRSGSEPGTLFELAGAEVEQLPPLSGINLHAFRWDHALAFAHWLLKDAYPAKVTVLLVEGGHFEPGEPLSPPVDRGVDDLCDRILALLAPAAMTRPAAPLPRPQPVGIFPFPASHLVLPGSDDPGAAEALVALLSGEMPASMPAEWGFFARAARGARPHEATGPDRDPAGASTAGLPAGDDWVSRYDRFVLAPGDETFTAVRTDAEPAAAALARSAAFALGVADTIPDPAGLDGELAALVEVDAAAGLIERGDSWAAIAGLERAFAAVANRSPLFAARIALQMADLAAGDATREATALDLLRRSLGSLGVCRLPLLEAEVAFRLGLALQASAQAAGQRSRPLLVEAIQAYQRALSCGIGPESRRDLFAEIQNNLGLAYLATPTREASDSLRHGIAIQAFRRAVEVADGPSLQAIRASALVNLASALQHAPSAHPRDNLLEAVAIYDLVLDLRGERHEPVARGLVLLNRANALAHLGLFGPAIDGLAEARRLLARSDSPEMIAAVDDLLGAIEERRAAARPAMEGPPG